MKIGLVGCGMVGSASAYALVMPLALPHLVGGDGALATIPLPLDETERAGLRRSAGVLREAIQSLQLQ